MNHTAQHIIHKLGLQQHPEGGYFKEIYRNRTEINNRNMATSIYFLLHDEEKSHFHKLTSDELWYYHEGHPLKVHMITPDGSYHYKILGSLTEGDCLPQLVIPAGTIFGAEMIDKTGYCLMGCMVSPGFHFDDFYLYTTSELQQKFPAHTNIIEHLT